MKIKFEGLTIPKLNEKAPEREINLEIHESSILNLPPSQGKTYLFEHIIGLRKKFLGSIKINGVKVDLELDSGFFELRKKLGILFEKPVFLSNLSLEENLRLILRNSHQNFKETQIHKIIISELKKYNLYEYAKSRPAELTQNQLKVGAFIMAMVHQPHLLIWDEPHSNFPDEILPTIKRELEELKERNGILLGFSSSASFAQDHQMRNIAL
jgi:ABC-type transporter Mla maintaining outer membrane lipid asymmetry ATPase subunit MlaF